MCKTTDGKSSQKPASPISGASAGGLKSCIAVQAPVLSAGRKARDV